MAIFSPTISATCTLGNRHRPWSAWHYWRMPDKPTSEEIRREAEKLRETAVDLMEHAALLIEKSADLERRILARDRPKTSKKS